MLRPNNLGVFHGYAVSWDGLSQKAKNSLAQHGIVNPKSGRIIGKIADVIKRMLNK